MKLGRRNFLSLFAAAGATVAAPTQGFQTTPFGAGAIPSIYPPGPTGAPPQDVPYTTFLKQKALRYSVARKLYPTAFRDHLLRSRINFSPLTDDIMSFRSVSPIMKQHMIRERIISLEEEEFWNSPQTNLARKLFEEVAGID